MVGIGEIIGKLNDGTEQGPDSDTNIDHHLIYDKCGGKSLFHKLVLGQLDIHVDPYFTTQKLV